MAIAFLTNTVIFLLPSQSTPRLLAGDTYRIATMKIDTGHTGSEADDASSDNRPLKNPRELPQDTPPNWEELSGIATPEADYQLRHYTLKEYIQPKQPVRTLLGAILGGWDPMAVPVYPYLEQVSTPSHCTVQRRANEQFGVEQFIRTRRIIWGLIVSPS